MRRKNSAADLSDYNIWGKITIYKLNSNIISCYIEMFAVLRSFNYYNKLFVCCQTGDRARELFAAVGACIEDRMTHDTIKRDHMLAKALLEISP